MQRASCYVHPDGESATIDQLVGAMIAHKGLIIEKNLGIYTSMDMKVGIDLTELTRSKQLLENLVRLDVRGGLYLQSHLASAVRAIIEEDRSKNLFMAKTISHLKPYEELVETIAYKMRVMLSHVRLSYDSSKNDEHHSLASIFEIMKDPPSCSNDARRSRRQQRLMSRPRPFVCFRPSEGESQEKEELNSIVTRYFDGEDFAAKLLLSDGSVVLADTYEPGEDGFVVARWAEPKAHLQLEVTNAYLQHGCLVKAVVKKRPAASASLAKDEEKPKNKKNEKAGERGGRGPCWRVGRG